MAYTHIVFLLIAIGSFANRYLLLRLIFDQARNRELLIYLLLWSSALGYFYAEAFSLFDGINFRSARVYWLIIGLIELALVYHLRSRKKVYWDETIGMLRLKFRNLFHAEFALPVALLIVLIVVPLFLLAVLTPPNNYDSNSYHLHRILAWTYFGNVEFYPTTLVQQLYHNVFAEYLVLNVYLFTGTDHFVNLVQFTGGLACISTLSLLGEKLGLNPRGQFIACIAMLTLPAGVFEMTTTQVDYTATFFFVAFLYFAYCLRESYNYISVVGLGLSLAFAAASKYPMFFYAFPFSIYFAVLYLKKYDFNRALIIGLTALLSLAIAFVPLWTRNYELFGHILSPPVGTELFAEKIPADAFGLRLSLSNILKNASLHLGLPYTGYNLVIEKAIRKVHNLIGVDVNQPEITLYPFTVRFTVHEDMVPNTLHFYLLIPFTLLLFSRRTIRDLRWFWILALAGLAIFATLLKYEPWCTRTHMPFFAMGCILIGRFLQNTGRYLRAGILTSMTLLAAVMVYGNPSKPVIPLPYLAKKALAHIPVYVCPPGSDQARYWELLETYYDFSTGTTGCYQLREFPNRKTRKNIITMLDDLGYYDPIKRTVFNQSRSDLYFLNLRINYESYRPLLKHITGTNPGVAVITLKEEGFYFFQKALLAAHGTDAEFRYALYRKGYNRLRNAHRSFSYKYILTDDQELVKKYVDISQAEVIESGRYALVILDKEMEGLFVF